MPIVERLEFPKKYKLKDTAILLIVLAAIAGIFYTQCTSKSREQRIIIHSIRFDELDQNSVRLGYFIENKGTQTESVELLAKVYDRQNEVLTSALFSVEVRPRATEYKTKYIDKWSRPLRQGEIPYRATLELHKKVLLGY